MGRKGYNSVENHVNSVVEKHVDFSPWGIRFSSKHTTAGSMRDRAGCVHSVDFPEQSGSDHLDSDREGHLWVERCRDNVLPGCLDLISNLNLATINDH